MTDKEILIAIATKCADLSPAAHKALSSPSPMLYLERIAKTAIELHSHCFTADEIIALEGVAIRPDGEKATVKVTVSLTPSEKALLDRLTQQYAGGNQTSFFRMMMEEAKRENKKVDKVTLAEYARIHGKDYSNTRRKLLAGGFETAEKVGRQWLIDPDEPYIKP